MLFDASTTIAVGLLVWLAMFVLILLTRRLLRIPGTGLELAYLVIFFMLHAPGAFIYLLPWYFNLFDGTTVVRGFELTWVSVLVFGIAFLLGLVIFRKMGVRRQNDQPVIELADSRLPWLLFGIGVGMYLLPQVVGKVPLPQSLTATLINLQVVGCIVGIWQGIREQKLLKACLWGAFSVLMPVLTILSVGSIVIGLSSAMTVGAFVISRIRLRIWYVFIIGIFLYVSLSLFVTYMLGRNTIRVVVGGGEGLSERIEVAQNELTAWQWFDWRNNNHLALIDGRMNQNYLVGLAQLNLENGFVSYAEGETIWLAAIGFIPRVIWPEKPIMAGGSTIVDRFALTSISYGTTVPAGQVLEFYVNFGWWGIYVGFTILGLIFAWVDSRSAFHLDAQNIWGFLRWYLIGLAIVEPVDDLTVLTAGTGGAVVTAYLLEYGSKFWFGRQSRPTLQTPSGTISAPLPAPPPR